jgi:hypothetical protein
MMLPNLVVGLHVLAEGNQIVPARVSRVPASQNVSNFVNFCLFFRRIRVQIVQH